MVWSSCIVNRSLSVVFVTKRERGVGREHPEWADSVKGCKRGYDVMLIFPFYRQGGGTFCVAPETMINIPAFPRGPENEEIKKTTRS